MPSIPEVPGGPNLVTVYTVQGITQWPKGVNTRGNFLQAVMSICAPPLFAQVRPSPAIEQLDWSVGVS